MPGDYSGEIAGENHNFKPRGTLENENLTPDELSKNEYFLNN